MEEGEGCVGVHAHTKFDYDIALYYMLTLPSHCIYTMFSVGGGENKAFILSNYTLPPPFTINNPTSLLYVSLFIVHV